MELSTARESSRPVVCLQMQEHYILCTVSKCITCEVSSSCHSDGNFHRSFQHFVRPAALHQVNTNKSNVRESSALLTFYKTSPCMK